MKIKYKEILNSTDWLSSVCIIHCLLTPVVLALYPFLINESQEVIAHSIILAFAILISIYSIVSGYKIHKNKAPSKYIALGLSLLVTNIIYHDLLHEVEIFVNILGSFLIIIGHKKNKKHYDFSPC